MSINNPRDPEMQNAYKSLAIVAVVLGALAISTILIQNHAIMSEAREFDERLSSIYQPHFERAVGLRP
ncbi:MAG: hypothetical protein JJ916_04170 [Phycisphaerales bacterium]|nr:hypothetical protein [Phycisphaerales bacterium]